MNFKKTFLSICLIVCLFAMAGICASAVNQDFNESNFECCSVVIQKENGAVFAFRQDAPLGEDGVSIHDDALDNIGALVQEIDSRESHFIHAIITEDGWVASHGGDSSNVDDTLALERIAEEMLISKNISSDSLSQIQNIFKKYKYGHFLIKAPDGRYGVVYSENYTMGTLNQSEFLVLPNEYDGFSSGNYTSYADDPVDAVIEICSYEDSGWNRRNIYSYDCNGSDFSIGQKYDVDVYVTNDNGYNVGLNTSEIVTYCYFNDDYYPESSIPQNPDKLCIANYSFENQSIDSAFEFLSNIKNTLINNTSPAEYGFKYNSTSNSS